MALIALTLFLIFLVLGGFHFYWLFGGSWGLKKVIPTKNNDSYALSTPKLATLMVGLVLVSFGLIYLIKSGLVKIPLPNWVTSYMYWIVPSIFILRAIGDFNYVGFFKRIKQTEFSKADSKIFSPLCLVIGILGLLIQLISK